MQNKRGEKKGLKGGEREREEEIKVAGEEGKGANGTATK